MSLLRSKQDCCLIPGYDNVVDFQESRMTAHMYESHVSLSVLVDKLSKILDLDPCVLGDVVPTGRSLLFYDMDVKKRQRNGYVVVTWTPVCLMHDTIRILYVHMSYGSLGASVVGVTLNLNGSVSYTPCTSYDSLERICVSYANSLLTKSDNHNENSPRPNVS